jgi:DNA-binding protein HU-beta
MASRQDLIDDLCAAHPELSKARANAFVKDLLATLAAALHRGEPVRLAGFGTFAVKDRAARTGRNPRTGATITLPATRVVRFRVAGALRRQVNTPVKRAKTPKTPTP